MFQSYGHEVAYVPVNDRPRLAGRSKYNNLNRALIGLYDLVGVTWLRRRTVVPPVVEDIPAGRQVTDMTSRLRHRGDVSPRIAHDGS
jgi:dolichol-phosphate mannosyltransferase